MSKFTPIFNSTIDIEIKTKIANHFKTSYIKNKNYFDELKNDVEVHFNANGFTLIKLIDANISGMQKIKSILDEFYPIVK